MCNAPVFSDRDLTPAVSRRESILHAAVDAFAARGYGGASLREIGAAAGVEKGHLSYYFRAKEDLLFEIVDDLHERFVEGITVWPGPATDDPEARLRRVLQAHVALVCELREQTKVAYESLRYITPTRREVIVAKRDRYEHGLGELIEGCRRNGTRMAEVPTGVLTKVVLGIVNWPYHWFSETGSRPATELATVLAARARAALAP